VTRRGDGARPEVASRPRRVLGRAVPWLVGAFYGLAMLDLVESPAAAWASVGLSAALAAALAWRYERPELVTGVVLGVSLGAHLLVPEVVVPVAGMVAVWALARTRPPRVSLVGLAGLLALSAANFATTTVDDTVFTMVLAVSVWALAEAARNRDTAITEAARRAAGEEQARIARELHDVIAHSVTVIVVQAGAARDVFDARPDQARAALASIEGAGREALHELRRLLAGVRSDGGVRADGGVGAAGDGPGGLVAHAPGVTAGASGAPVPPQPGLDRIDELAAPLRAAGLEVVIVREGTEVALPMGVDISAYRIVQEALTNTLRHAQATVATVTVGFRSDALDIEVVDDGRAGAGRGWDGGGLGLVGMNERVASLGGTLEVGPTGQRGFRVRAQLPVEVVR
jgi:signal transduction histidine kinase